MYRKSVVFCGLLALGATVAVAVDNSPSHAKLSATQIVDKNISARGGLEAWRAVQSLSLHGKIDAGNKVRPTLAAIDRKPIVKARCRGGRAGSIANRD